MDFQSVNPLNFRLSLISGNLLPMTGDNTPFPVLWRIHRVLMWSLHLLVLIAFILGCKYSSKEQALQISVVYVVISLEILFMVTRIYAYSDVLGRTIRCLNNILRSADNSLKDLVTAAIQSVKFPLTFYCFIGIMTEFIYHCISIQLLLDKDVFWYKDYSYPIALFTQPMSRRTFFLGSLIIAINGIWLSIKKISMDVYLVHLVLMITVQYRYSALRLSAIFQNHNENMGYKSREIDSDWTKTELRILCQHHNILMHMSLLVKKVLPLMCVVLHISGVLRFCFLGISTMFVENIWEVISYAIYIIGSLVQLYILCSCVQQLLDASTEVTSEAFHQEWYLFDSSTKKIFMLLIMANNLECKLATVDSFNLTLPSFMKILNQAYSVALLFLRMR